MTITHDFDGPYGSGRYHLTGDDGELVRTLSGKEAGWFALLLSGWQVKENVQFRDALEKT